MKKIIFGIALFIFLFFPYKEVFACKCMQPGSPSEEIQKADAVFSGTVVRIDKREISAGGGFFEDSYKATFVVEKAWKGISKKTVIVDVGSTESCGYSFEENESYIVYAYGENETALSTSGCTRTNKVSFANEDIKELGAGITELSDSEVPPPIDDGAFHFQGRVYPYDRLIILLSLLIGASIFITVMVKNRKRIGEGVISIKKHTRGIIASIVIAGMAGAAVYFVADARWEKVHRRAVVNTRSELLEQIADLKIENRKLKGTIETLEKTDVETTQACTPALAKEGDDPILQTLIEASPVIAHVKINSIDEGKVKEEGAVEFIAIAEVIQLYKGTVQMREGTLRFGFNRFMYLTRSDIQKGESFYKNPIIKEREAVEQDGEYIVFLKLPASAGVGGGAFLTYQLPDRWISIQPYDRYLEDRIMKYASPPLKRHLDKNQCLDLAKEVAVMFDEANYCTQDSDCIAHDEFLGCGMLCYTLASKKSFWIPIHQGIQTYNTVCPDICDSRCLPPPQPQDIKCIKNKCVDTRLP